MKYYYGCKKYNTPKVPTTQRAWLVLYDDDLLIDDLEERFNLKEVRFRYYKFTKILNKLGLLDFYELQKT